ncbi:hypothetical protein LTR10_003814 [Elasticomyces elasticus]|nr:hypothetical protein LTR10_003814 [Elasticomyces elasticus]KAK4977999.1 hypothetical protein LTR42_002374 [Elasticomyces elasticus]
MAHASLDRRAKTMDLDDDHPAGNSSRPDMCKQLAALSLVHDPQVESKPFRLQVLPPEMIQHIFSFVSTYDLPTLRLVSRHIAAQSLSPFARDYLDTVQCYFTDPVRLQRVHNIISAPSLRNSVRHLVLTMSPYEDCSMRTVPVVPSDGNTIQGTQHKIWYTYRNDEMLRLHSQPPDYGRIRLILAKLHSIGAAVGLDFDDSGYIYSDQPYAAEIWTLTAHARCRIFWLVFTDEIDSDVQRLIESSGHDMLDNMKTLYFDVSSRDKSRRATAEPSSALTVWEDAGESASPQELDLTFFDTAENRDDQLFSEIEFHLLHEAKLNKLWSLCLTNMRLQHDDVLCAIQSCHTRLTSLWLDDVELVTSKDIWTEFLRYAQLAPNLWDIWLGPLWRVHRGRKYVVMMCVDEQDEYEGVRTWECHDRAGVRKALTTILDNGLQYI